MPQMMRLGDSGPSDVCLAIPSYGNPSPGFVFALAASIRELEKQDISYYLLMLSGHCHVDDARNSLVKAFLDTESRYLMFIDTDLSWHPPDLIKLIRYDRDMVAGVYPKKKDDTEFPCRLLPGENHADSDGLLEVEAVPTGFLKIKRWVLEKIPHQSFLETDDEYAPLLFERTIVGNRRFSGDYSFCHKFRAIGGKIYIDPEIRFDHIGDTVWQGCYGSYLRSENGLPLKGISDIINGSWSAETLVNLYQDWGNDFAATPELMMACMEMVRDVKTDVLEIGTGLTTLCMAAINPNITIHALEHNAMWMTKIQSEIKRQGLENIEIHFAPLRDYGNYKWYDADLIPKMDFSVVLCDGPPRKEGNRKGLYEHVNLGKARVLMDDADDPAQVRNFTTWADGSGRTHYTLGKERPFMVA